MKVRFPQRTETVTVAGTFSDRRAIPYNGDYILSLDGWSERFTDALDTYVVVILPDDVSAERAKPILEGIARDFGIEAENKTEFKDRQIAQFDQILGLMYVLLLFAVIIALIGIVNTLALSIFERTREIGLLRAVGMTRPQLRRMVRTEALVVAVFGSLLGLVIGVFFGGAIVRTLQSDGIEFSLPVGQLITFVILAGAAGLLAGMPPARRAARLDVLQAINTE
jgi:putative ABC transport system permease protein